MFTVASLVAKLCSFHCHFSFLGKVFVLEFNLCVGAHLQIRHNDRKQKSWISQQYEQSLLQSCPVAFQKHK